MLNGGSLNFHDNKIIYTITDIEFYYNVILFKSCYLSIHVTYYDYKTHI